MFMKITLVIVLVLKYVINSSWVMEPTLNSKHNINFL